MKVPMLVSTARCAPSSPLTRALQLERGSRRRLDSQLLGATSSPT